MMSFLMNKKLSSFANCLEKYKTSGCARKKIKNNNFGYIFL